jgi:recombinational DNA repair protein (RecF pathway)
MQEALVLRGLDYREADRLVSYWIPEYGRLDAVVRGAKRSAAKLAGAAQPLHWVRLQLKQGRGALAQVTQYETLHSFETLRNHWLALSGWLFLLELLYTQHESLQDEAALLYSALLQTATAMEALLKEEELPAFFSFNQLESKEQRAVRASLLFLLLLQLYLLRALGYLPSWALASVLSHTPLSSSVVALPFSVILGGVLHPHELPQLEQNAQQQVLRVSRGTLNVLHYLSQNELLDLAEAPVLFKLQHQWLWNAERLPLAPLIKAQRLLCQVLEQSCHRTFHGASLLRDGLSQIDS